MKGAHSTVDAVAGPPTAPAPQPPLRLWIALARAHAAISARAAADVERHGLTISEFAVLEALYHKGPLLLGALQRAVLVSSGGITFIVDRLAGRGFVRRRAADHDRRARYAELTDDGRALIARLFPEHAAELRAVLDTLTHEEQNVAIRLLRRLAQAAGS